MASEGLIPCICSASVDMHNTVRKRVERGTAAIMKPLRRTVTSAADATSLPKRHKDSQGLLKNRETLSLIHFHPQTLTEFSLSTERARQAIDAIHPRASQLAPLLTARALPLLSPPSPTGPINTLSQSPPKTSQSHSR